MRIIADENLPRPIIESLRADGHDVLWARTDLAQTSDVALLDLAESEGRIVLTLIRISGRSRFSAEAHWKDLGCPVPSSSRDSRETRTSSAGV
jgi:hypothetical protein